MKMPGCVCWVSENGPILNDSILVKHTHSEGDPLHSSYSLVMLILRDWSLIMGTGGGLQNGRIAGPKPFVPPPSRQGKTFCTHPF